MQVPVSIQVKSNIYHFFRTISMCHRVTLLRMVRHVTNHNDRKLWPSKFYPRRTVLAKQCHASVTQIQWSKYINIILTILLNKIKLYGFAIQIFKHQSGRKLTSILLLSTSLTNVWSFEILFIYISAVLCVKVNLNAAYYLHWKRKQFQFEYLFILYLSLWA